MKAESSTRVVTVPIPGIELTVPSVSVPYRKGTELSLTADQTFSAVQSEPEREQISVSYSNLWESFFAELAAWLKRYCIASVLAPFAKMGNLTVHRTDRADFS